MVPQLEISVVTTLFPVLLVQVASGVKCVQTAISTGQAGKELLFPFYFAGQNVNFRCIGLICLEILFIQKCNR